MLTIVCTEYLFFGTTSFSGPNVKLPPNLKEYTNSYSLINGPLDPLEPNVKIEYLELDGNSYNSSIPVSWGQFADLVRLYIADGFVEGTLAFLGEGVNMPNLFEMWIDQNENLGGPIPTHIGKLAGLGSLAVTENGLTGNIPTEMGDLTELGELWLYGNKMTGNIPTEMGNLNQLSLFESHNNQFSGDMPAEICANKDVSLFDLSTNCEVTCTCCDFCS